MVLYLPGMIYSSFSYTGSGNPDYCPVVRFFKKFILGTYMSWGVSGCKHLPDKMSGIPFLPLIGHFPAFVSMHHIYTTKMIIKYSFYAPDLELIWITFSLIGNTIACSGLFKSNKSLKVLKKNFKNMSQFGRFFIVLA